ncbi:hypothetical protein BH11ACT8_BH11ACT8_16320 [soil metagenome]
MHLSRPSPALFVSALALLMAVSGVSYAAGQSGGDTIIKKGSLSGNRLRPDTVTGPKIKESTLGKVPRAARADHATSAGHATSADSAANAAYASEAVAAETAYDVVDPTRQSLYNYGNGWVSDSLYDTNPLGSYLDAEHFVHLQGAMTRTSGSATVLGTLAGGHRPPGNLYLPVYTTSQSVGTLLISPDGNMTLLSGNSSFVSLEGIVFAAA